MKLAIVAFTLLASTQARADECRVTAVLDGDSALVDAIDSALRERGIATKATAACPTTTALVERRDNAIAVTITDPYGRRSTRMIEDASAAATLIESWARQDMNASALVGWTEAPPAPAGPPSVVAPRVDAVVTPAKRGHQRDPLTLAVATEASLGTDSSSWLGARASLCVRIVGPVCAGATGRYLADTDRSSIDLLGGVFVSRTISHRVIVVGGVSVGAGRFSSPFSRGELMTTKTATGVRIDATTSIAVMLARHVSLHVGLSAGASPQAPMTIEMDGDSPLDNGEPGAFVRGELGLRIGVP